MRTTVLITVHPDAQPRPDVMGEPPPIPRRQTEHSAGMDLVAWLPETWLLHPGRFLRVPTGVAVAIPPGFEGQVRPRSGLAAKDGITVLNSPGTIDADYRGQISVVLFNASDRVFALTRGLRIAQLVIAAVAEPLTLEVVTSLPESARGQGGFGSTGR